MGFFSLVFHCVGSWISFKPLHFECSLISLAGGYTKGFQWRLGSRTGPTTTLKYFFFTIPLHSFLSNKFYCLKYLQVCVFFVCMIKSTKKKKTLLNCSGSLCHKEMFIDGHIFGRERLFLESRHRMWCSSGRTCVLWSLTSDSSLWPTVDLKIQDYSICTLYIDLYYRNTIVLVYEWCRDENPVYLQ